MPKPKPVGQKRGEKTPSVTPSGTQGPKSARKAGPPIPFTTRRSSRKTVGITEPTELPLPAEVENTILKQQEAKRNKERQRRISAAAAAAPAPSRKEAAALRKAGKRPVRTTPAQQAAEALEGIGKTAIAPALVPGACPLAGAGPIVIEGGEHYDLGEYEAWLEKKEMDPERLKQFIENEKVRFAEINAANEVYSLPERDEAVRKQLNRSAELMVRQLSINNISQRLYGITAAVTHGHLLHFAGATSYINDLIDTVIANGGVPEIILDTLAIIRSNRIPEIAVGGALQSETVMQIAGTLNGMALIRFAMNMNEALLGNVVDEELEARGPSQYDIIKQLTESTLPLEQQLEIIKGFVLSVTNELIEGGVAFVQGTNPYEWVLNKLSDPEIAGAIRDGAFGYIQEAIQVAIHSAAHHTQTEATLRARRARMAQADRGSPFQRTDETGAVVLQRAEPTLWDFTSELASSAAAGLLGLTGDIAKVALLASPPDPSGPVHRAYHFVASGMYNLYTEVCPGMHGRAVDEAFEQLVKDEQEKIAGQLTEAEIAAILEMPPSARALEIEEAEMTVEEKLAYFKELRDDIDEHLKKDASIDDSQDVLPPSSQPSSSQGGARKRKHHSTRSSKSSKSSKSSTRKHGKPKSKRAKKSGAKTRHMGLAPGAGRRTRKHRE